MLIEFSKRRYEVGGVRCREKDRRRSRELGAARGSFTGQMTIMPFPETINLPVTAALCFGEGGGGGGGREGRRGGREG